MEEYLIANGYNWDGTTIDNKIAKSLAAQTDWKTSTDSGAIGNDLTKNNESGFSALPGGYRNLLGNFYGINEITFWWSATGSGTNSAWFLGLHYNHDFLARDGTSWSGGYYVRLVRD